MILIILYNVCHFKNKSHRLSNEMLLTLHGLCLHFVCLRDKKSVSVASEPNKFWYFADREPGPKMKPAIGTQSCLGPSLGKSFVEFK